MFVKPSLNVLQCDWKNTIGLGLGHCIHNQKTYCRCTGSGFPSSLRASSSNSSWAFSSIDIFSMVRLAAEFHCWKYHGSRWSNSSTPSSVLSSCSTASDWVSHTKSIILILRFGFGWVTVVLERQLFRTQAATSYAIGQIYLQSQIQIS